MTTRTNPATRTFAQIAALVFGVVFLLVGVLGFIPGITQGVDQLTLFGPDSGAMLLGVFHVSILHNVVHLLFGVAGILMARTLAGARAYLIGSGVLYLVLVIYGLLVPADSPANFVPVNPADNWLHIVLAVALLGAGILLVPRRTKRATRR